VPVRDKIQAYCAGVTGEDDREQSWLHCYRYFRGFKAEALTPDLDHAALHLGFYLASWGMYRGSSFLPRYAYTIHRGIVEQLVEPKFSALWDKEFGSGPDDTELVPVILEAIDAFRETYKPFAGTSVASDTLLTKIMLVTFGSLPACDRYFVAGFKADGYGSSYLSAAFIQQLLSFCRSNLGALREEQERIVCTWRVRYPLMKLVDMYFWQIGYERYDQT
jgi:hypothetical protein